MRYLLFVTPGCPKCPAVKKWCEQHPECSGEIIEVRDTDSMQKAADNMVQSAPTIIFWNDDGKELFRTDSVTELEILLSEQK